jgi:FtsP/CotA-like multicopper oxidase with cupredoxin domain
MFPSDPVQNPEIHPDWVPEFFGDTIMVNGNTWPNLNVDQGQYTFVVLDGSNARFYNLSMSNHMPFTVIARDENWIRSPVTLTSFLISPGERVTVLVDFTSIGAGTKILMKNDAVAPYSSGDPVENDTTAQIMQFTVVGHPGFTPKTLPTILNPSLNVYPSLSVNSTPVVRNLTMKESQGPNGPELILQDGQVYHAPATENMKLGTTEVWNLIDDTADAHPIHWHLLNVQVVSRQTYDQSAYDNDWMALNGGVLPFANATKNVDLTNYLTGNKTAASPYEQAWQDTVQIYSGEVVTVLVRAAPVAGGSYPFDVTQGPPYVWHCHIVDHEDNEMMRPLKIVA